MERPSLRDDTQASGPDGAGWSYWRPAVDGIVELGTVRGHEVGLPTHFHDEDQITFVLSGRRRFLVGGGLIDFAAGQGASIPAGAPHRSLAEPSGVLCFNAYVPAGGCAAAAVGTSNACGAKQAVSAGRSWRRRSAGTG